MTNLVNTANTLSLNFRPGEDFRIGNSLSESIFTYGDYRIERSIEPNSITGTGLNLTFSPFSTLENMGIDDFKIKNESLKNNELKFKKTDPYSYVYFGSFYTEVARSINNIVNNFPYAALAFDNFQGLTVFDYLENFNNITNKKTSSFKIPVQNIINEGYILFNSGSSIGNQVSLLTQTKDFEIQLSASTTAQTPSYKINSYSFISGVSPYLEFEIDGFLFEGAPIPISGTTSTAPIYIRPSKKRVLEYKLQQSRLERQILEEGYFDVPDDNTANKFFTFKIDWPRTIDGFNPDTKGSSFEQYKDKILSIATSIDQNKTDIMIKTMIPENLLDFDTKNQIYKKIISSYAKEFDDIKNFIDNIAYAHSIDYNENESVPDKFLIKLSNLLGWNLSGNFKDIDLFDFFSKENEEKNSFAFYNIELWKKILININWLYKRKGTRDALQFLFKLMGAPDCLIVFDEFVYKIQRTITQEYKIEIDNEDNNQIKNNSNGFINFDSSKYIFQEGGVVRGNGEKYINQWRPEFDPVKMINNIKTKVGDEEFNGTENIVNTKELYATISPANSIECDVFNWYKINDNCWKWGSDLPYFSANTIPFEYTIDNCEFVKPENISEMTLNEYIEFIYMSNIETRNRKTNNQVHTSWGYPEMKKIYMNYFLHSNPQSNQLTFKKLEAFLNLIEVNFQNFLLQLIPATTILNTQGTTYRNTVFQRQRFVYKEGINDGSEFQVGLIPNIKPNISPLIISSKINDYIKEEIQTITINAGITQGINCGINIALINCNVNQNNINTNIGGFELDFETQLGTQQITTGP